MNHFLILSFLALLAGFLEPGSAPAAGATLGIAHFRTIETADKTTIVGVDNQGRPVARLDLIHGRFRPTEDFGPEYRNRDVEGRKLNVEVRGQTFEWQTPGYTDTLHMPPLPPNRAAVASFLSSSTVRPLLVKWRIGWEPSEAAKTVQASQVDSGACDYAGTNPISCTPGGNNNLTCRLRAGNTSACNGTPAYQGQVVSQDAATFGWEQDIVSACCGNAVNGAYLTKTCAVASGTNGCPPGEFCSSCGNSGGNRCKPCFTPTPYTAGCTLSAPDSGYVNQSGAPVALACYAINPAPGRTLESLGKSHLWLGLKNSDDQGTRFDVRTEVYKNSTLVASGLTRCIAGVTRNPNNALEATVSFDPISPVTYEPGDVLFFRVLTRIGTNSNDTKCPGHNNATGLELYYDGLQRQSRFDADLHPGPVDPNTNLGSLRDNHLHSWSQTDFLNVVPSSNPLEMSKASPSLSFSGGNVWKEVGTWATYLP